MSQNIDWHFWKAMRTVKLWQSCALVAGLDPDGTKAVELDAIPVQLLQQKLREAIEQYLDMDEFNAQLKLEQRDAVEIEAYRKVLMETITPIKKDDSEDPPLPVPTT